MKPTTILKRMLALYKNPKRWTQHTYDDYAGAYCMLGGIGKVQGMNFETRIAGKRAQDFLKDALRAMRKRGDVMAFNDAKGRKITEVRAVIRKALALARRA
jgi:hypothetical protein